MFMQLLMILAPIWWDFGNMFGALAAKEFKNEVPEMRCKNGCPKEVQVAPGSSRNLVCGSLNIATDRTTARGWRPKGSS